MAEKKIKSPHCLGKPLTAIRDQKLIKKKSWGGGHLGGLVG